jgi:GYF domain 2
MQVVCNHCHAVCEVDADRFAAPSSALSCDVCRAPLALPAVEIGPETRWLVLMPHGQAGPYGAGQMAELLDQASIDWSSLVWRAGLKGWRSARRDPELVTSVASARGASAYGDTQRVSMSSRALMPAADTIVEPLKRALARRSSDAFALAGAAAVAPDSGEYTQVTQRVAPPDPPVLEAKRSAPPVGSALQREAKNSDTQPVVARASTPNSWLPSAQSMFLVAIVAFGFGVLAAALWGRYVVRHAQRPATVLVRPVPQPVPVAEPVLVAPERVAEAPPLDVRSLGLDAPHELPLDVELRREVRRISPDVRRCLDDLSRGAEVEIYFEGSNGRVGELRLRTPGFTPGRIECITQALRQMQVAPFSRAHYKFWHRFSY